MFKQFISAIIFISFATSICETPAGRPGVMEAYRASAEKKFLGAGGFGSVKEFAFDGKTYAVKKIMLAPHRSYDEFIAAQGSEGLENAVNFIDNELDSYYYFESHVGKEKVLDIIHRSGAEAKYVPFLISYIEEMITEAHGANKEMRIQRKLGQAQPGDPGRMHVTFNFCIRDSGYVFFLFQDKYEEDWASADSQLYFEQSATEKRFGVYETLLRRLKFVHDEGLVHCDIKPENVMWTDAQRSDVVIVDFGLAASGEAETCNGGTRGYRAPENIADDVVEDIPINSFKADVYSLGALVADFEVSRADSDHPFTDAQSLLEKAGTLAENHDSLIARLESWIDEASAAYKKSSPLNAANMAHFYDQLKRVLKALLKKNYKERADLNMAYRHIWYLHQLAKKLEAPWDEFNIFAIDLRLYLHTYPDKANFFSLPAEMPAAQVDEPLEEPPSQKRLLI